MSERPNHTGTYRFDSLGWLSAVVYRSFPLDRPAAHIPVLFLEAAQGCGAASLSTAAAPLNSGSGGPRGALSLRLTLQ